MTKGEGRDKVGSVWSMFWGCKNRQASTMKATVFIRRDTDYALRALSHLADLDGQRASGGDIAERCEIPRSFAYKILKRMCEAGIVTSRTGRTGGFHLSRDAGEVSLGAVVGAVQGSIEVSRCALDPKVCVRSGDCPLCMEWQRMQDQLSSYLERTTLRDIARSFERSKSTQGSKSTRGSKSTKGSKRGRSDKAGGRGS